MNMFDDIKEKIVININGNSQTGNKVYSVSKGDKVVKLSYSNKEILKALKELL